MRAIQIHGQLPQLVHLPTPSHKEGWVNIQVASASICGSDLHMMAMGFADGVVLGHEFAGFTEDGRAVAVEPLVSCGTCWACNDGLAGHCEHGAQFLGVMQQGAMAEQVSVPVNSLYELPSGLPVENACLIEPLAIAYHGINRANIEAGDSVLVIGAGAIGLAAVAVLTAQGLNVDVRARHDAQQQAAESLGAGLKPVGQYSVIVDCVGTSTSLAEAVRYAKPQARLVLLGTPWDGAQFDVGLCMKEISLLPSTGYRVGARAGRSFDAVAKVLLAKPGISELLITHRFPLEAAKEAFETASDRAAGAIKVAFIP